MSSSCINDRLLQYKNDRSEASLKQLMEAASPQLQRYLERSQSHLDPSIDADDLLQETWLRVTAGIGLFQGVGGTAWLFKTLQRVISRRLRYQTRAKRLRPESLQTDPGDTAPGDPSSVERQHTITEIQSFVHRMLSNVDASTREMLKLFYFDGWSQQAIGTLYNISENAVECRLRQTRDRLKKQFSRILI